MVCQGEKIWSPETAFEKAWEGGLFLKGSGVDGAPGPTAGCAYPSLNVWPRWGKDGCRIFSGWFLPGNKHGVPVSRVLLAWLSKVLSNATNEIGHFRKTIDYE